jgi:PAS domain S-box-containing protein
VLNALHTHENLNDSLREVLKRIGQFTGHVAGEAWFMHRDGHVLQRRAIWTENPELESLSSDEFGLFQYGVGLPGITAKTGKLQFWDKLVERKRFLRREIAKKLNLTEGVGVPVLLGGKIVAVFTLFGTRQTIDQTFVTEVLNRIALQIGIDVKRKATSEELNQSYASSPQLICIVGTDGFFRKVNPAFTKLLGYSEKELLSKPFDFFVHPDDREVSIDVLESNETGYVTDGLENRYITKSGEIRWISWHSSEMLEEEGLVFGFGTDITAIKNANIQLIKYKHLVEQTRDGIGMFTLADESIYVNEGFEAQTGYSSDEVKALGGPLAMYPDQKRAEEMFTAILSGAFWKGDIQLKTKNGEIIDYFLSAGPIVDFRGDLIAVYGIHTDIRDRKRYERELREASVEKEAILSSIRDGFFSMNRTHEINYWNKEAERLTGLRADDVIGNPATEIFADLKAGSAASVLLKVLQSVESHSEEFYFDATDTWIQFTVYPSENGGSVFFRDISETKTAQADRERLLEVVDRSLNEVYIFDRDTLVFQYVNSGALANLGYTLEEMRQKTPLSIKPAYDLESFTELVSPLIQGEEDKIIFETLHLRKGGSHYPVEVHLQLITHQNISSFVAVILDITERRKQEEALRKLNRQLNRRARELAASNAELEQFAYVASHDLQEPLRMVTSFLDRLESRYADKLDDKAKQYIHFATDGAHRMRQTILDLLEFSRIDRSNEDFTEIDLNELMNEVKLMCTQSLSESDGKLIWSDLPVVNGWYSPLKQIFQNLIVNAIKYRNENVEPKIKITARKENDFWQISVADNGIGIEERYYEKIFMIFQRLHQKEAYGGTGIGLAICRKIVEQHGGKIWVNSVVGKGSEFCFTLPIHSPHTEH